MRSLVKSTVDELRRVARKTAASAAEGDEGMDVKELELSRQNIVDLLGLADDVDDDAMAAAIKALQKKVEAGEAGGKDDGALADLAKKNEDQAARILRLENSNAVATATEAADAAIKASKFAPAVRDQLISMALSNGESFAKLVDNTPVNVIMAGGALGSQDPENFDLAKYEPSQEALAVATQMGVTRDEFILEAIKESGDQVPEVVLAKLQPKTD